MPRPPVDYDAELRRHNQVLRRACGVRRHDHVLDVGCGTGQTTRQAARTATAGDALGVDLSASMIDRARELAQAQGLRNVSFQRADAQVHRFPPEQFDLAISRFGTMFFDDPVAAFANIARALRLAGRLVMMVWQGHEQNEWEVAIRRSLEGFEEPAAVAPAGPDPFSLADPAAVDGILDAAGFAETGSGSTRAPGSSPPADADRAAAGSVSPTRPRSRSRTTSSARSQGRSPNRCWRVRLSRPPPHPPAC